jgi:hypothetical protein
MTDSWTLKLDRAEHHVKEVNEYIAAFAKDHPYDVVRQDIKIKGKKHATFQLHFTSEPDERLAVVVGDVVHNIRSALDHLMVAIAGDPGMISFGIFRQKPYGDNGQPLDNDDGKRWAHITGYLSGDALTQFKMLQPFQPTPEDVAEYCAGQGIDPVDIHALAQLNRLDNADKHRKLIPVAQGLSEHSEVTMTSPNGDVASWCIIPRVPDGTEVTPRVKLVGSDHAEMDVKIVGIPFVAVDAGNQKGGLEIPGVLVRTISHAREVCDKMAAFAGHSLIP